jgi:hypothetical protein
VGLGIALASAGALLAAAFASTPFSPTLALAAGIATFAAWVTTRSRTRVPFEVGVSSSGEIKLRERDSAVSDASGSAPVRIAFAAPWLISLRRGTMLVAIWPDSLPPSTFRRLWVHLRWGRVVPSNDDRGATPTNPANSMDH